MTEAEKYLHGFSEKEQQRLVDQANLLAPLVYEGLDFNQYENVIEIGSGVGAQTLQLLNRFPRLKIVCIENSIHQVRKAKELLGRTGHAKRVEIFHANAESLPFKDNSFDGAYVCWVLEHVEAPLKVLKETNRVLKNAGSIYIREVFNKLLHFSPQNLRLELFWKRFNNLQIKLGGDPYIGAELGTLLTNSGFDNIDIQFRTKISDRRDIKDRNLTYDYWCALLQSAFYCPKDLAELEKHFKNMKADPDSSMFFGFAAASAKKTEGIGTLLSTISY